MFERATDYPKAIASYDDEGVEQAIDWCCERMEEGDTLTVWTSQKSNLRNCPVLERFVHQHANVEHVVGRGGGFVRGRGPVLMAWGDMDDLGQLAQHGGSWVTALCVITWNDDAIAPWVATVDPTILGDGAPWEATASALDPVVVEAMKAMMINHNNTIAAGYEKDQVVRILLAVYDADISMDAEAMQAWALANGWSGKNPKKLAEYVTQINAGKRPRCSGSVPAGYIDLLRERVTATDASA